MVNQRCNVKHDDGWVGGGIQCGPDIDGDGFGDWIYTAAMAKPGLCLDQVRHCIYLIKILLKFTLTW